MEKANVAMVKTTTNLQALTFIFDRVEEGVLRCLEHGLFSILCAWKGEGSADEGMID